MNSIQFHTTVGPDQVIRPPAGVALPEGEFEVVMRRRPTEPTAASLEPTRTWLMDLAAEAQIANPDLPPDLASNHDHYAHGKPLP